MITGVKGIVQVQQDQGWAVTRINSQQEVIAHPDEDSFWAMKLEAWLKFFKEIVITEMSDLLGDYNFFNNLGKKWEFGDESIVVKNCGV